MYRMVEGGEAPLCLRGSTGCLLGYGVDLGVLRYALNGQLLAFLAGGGVEVRWILYITPWHCTSLPGTVML